jgi:hypothetical protein
MLAEIMEGTGHVSEGLAIHLKLVPDNLEGTLRETKGREQEEHRISRGLSLIPIRGNSRIADD